MSEPLKGVQYIHNMVLFDLAEPQKIKLNPTIDPGDFQISRDNGVFANLAIKPTVDPVNSRNVKVTISSLEMDVDKVVVIANDQAGDEWSDTGFAIDVPTGTAQTAVDLLVGDKRETSISQKVFKKGTPNIILEKVVTGSLLRSDITIETQEP